MTAKLVLLRHGQSTWNAENLFTGWWDADLSERGADEARQAGRLMADAEVVDVGKRMVVELRLRRLGGMHARRH